MSPIPLAVWLPWCSLGAACAPSVSTKLNRPKVSPKCCLCNFLFSAALLAPGTLACVRSITTQPVCVTGETGKMFEQPGAELVSPGCCGPFSRCGSSFSTWRSQKPSRPAFHVHLQHTAASPASGCARDHSGHYRVVSFLQACPRPRKLRVCKPPAWC